MHLILLIVVRSGSSIDTSSNIDNEYKIVIKFINVFGALLLLIFNFHTYVLLLCL